MSCTEHTTARDALNHIASQCDSELTRSAAPHLYWQAVGAGAGADDTLHALDEQTLLTDFVTSSERDKRRLRLVVNFEFPRASISPQARSKPGQLIGESPDVIRANASGVIAPTATSSGGGGGGVQLLRSLSSTLLRAKPGAPSLAKSTSLESASAVVDDDLSGALVFASTSLTTSERECWRCHTWLAGDVVSAAGHHLHPSCFECDECHASLLSTLRYGVCEPNDRILCSSCFRKRPAVVVAPTQPAQPAQPPVAVVQPTTAPAINMTTPPTRVRQQQLGMHRTSFTNGVVKSGPPPTEPATNTQTSNESN
jgi:hypothetical protein